MNPGILFALIALIAWGCDDLFIEKASRKLGTILALFYVTTFGTIVLLPFVWKEITDPGFWSNSGPLLILGLATIITTIAALLDYEALRMGKLSIVEPIYALEVPITLILGLLVIQEVFSPIQILLVLAITGGIFLVSSKSLTHLKHFTWERGVALALGSAIFMGGANFLTGLSGRITSPLVANWFIYVGIALVMAICLLKNKKYKEVPRKLIQHTKIILAVSMADLVAWVSFAYSALYIPIALATAISEAYIALGALLGLIINKERLQSHQFLGIGIVILAVITLSYIS